MSYTPTTWVTGDKVTATKLNKMEQGIAGAGSAMIVTETSGDLDKTFTEIYSALHSGTPVYVKRIFETGGPSSDYECYVVLGSIFMAHKYADTYVVYASFYKEGQSSGLYYASSPCVITYLASSASVYPNFARVVYPQSVSYSEHVV